MSDLLKLIKTSIPESIPLPNDCCTLMMTRKVTTPLNITNLSGGKYIHFGLCNSITRSLVYYDIKDIQEIKININIDGLPLSKSSNGQFWPILGALVLKNLYTKPFPIGIFYGESKPNDANTFLENFVSEYNNIKQNGGIEIVNKIVPLHINAIICNAPARSFVTGVKGHNAYFACGKCTTEGDFFKNRVTFPELTATLRTDYSFSNRLQPEHHKYKSCLENLGIGMVTQVPNDYMHLVCLGVVKRLLQFWIKGKMNIRLKPHQIAVLSSRLLKIQICKEFARVPRGVETVDHWKATEFRQFLLYTGVVILQEVLPKRLYMHFLCLSTAIRILLDDELSLKLIDYAQRLLIYFVKEYSSIYGGEYISFNVHNLIHLCSDVRNFGPLDNFSAFKYESFMYNLKQKVGISRNPLQQVTNRIKEEFEVIKRHVAKHYPELKFFDKDAKIIKCVEFMNYTISCEKPNNFCILSSDKIIRVRKIVMKDGNLQFFGILCEHILPMFEEPCDSSILLMYKCPYFNNFNKEVSFNKSDIKRKCFAIHLKEFLYLLPLIHQIN